LKEKDLAIGGVLKHASQKIDFEISLCQIEVRETGQKYDDYGTPERSILVKEFVGLDGKSQPDIHKREEISIEENELLPQDALDDIDFDKEEVEEDTGNAGATFERWYKTAAIVFWKPDSEEESEEEEEEEGSNEE
jgi:hypothetical protein